MGHLFGGLNGNCFLSSFEIKISIYIYMYIVFFFFSIDKEMKQQMGEQQISFAQRYRLFREAGKRYSSATLPYLVDTCSLDYLGVEGF